MYIMKRAPAPLGSWQTGGEVGFGIACSVQAGRLGTLCALGILCTLTWATALVQFCGIFACSLSNVYYVD